MPTYYHQSHRASNGTTMKVIVPFALIALPALSAAQQSVYLKEMILGRCYFQPPSGEEADIPLCQSLVGSFLSVVESRLDDSIAIEDFATYMEHADFSPGKGALFWPPSASTTPTTSDVVNDAVVGTAGTIRPEGTPGGALLADLVFCGVDKREECPSDGSSGASLAFWTGAYAKFATDVRGSVQIVLTEGANLVPLLAGAITSLDASAVASVVIFSSSSCKSKDVALVESALVETAGIDADTIACTTNELRFDMMVRCDGDEDYGSPMCVCMEEVEEPPEEELVPTIVATDDDTTHEEAETASQASVVDNDDHSQGGGTMYKPLFWILVLVGGACWVHSNRHRPSDGYESISSDPALPKQ